MLSEQATQRCWNGRSQDTGYDNSYPVQFTEQAQLNNPILAYQRYTAPPILNAVKGLQDALDFTDKCEKLEHVLPVPGTMSLFEPSDKSATGSVTGHVLLCTLVMLILNL